eukprot:jgi/Psemu1/8013/gm1.8013_g
MAPARRFGGGGGRGPAVVDAAPGLPEGQRPATLYATPRTIQALWDEEFTAAERGRVKFKYSNRKVVWSCMERLLNRGNDVNTAISKIKRVYGDVSITKLIKAMRADERRGGNPALQ